MDNDHLCDPDYWFDLCDKAAESGYMELADSYWEMAVRAYDRRNEYRTLMKEVHYS